MICCAVIDTNVLVSALLSSHEDAATVQVVGKIFSGEIIPLYSEEILKEYYDVLSRRKFRFTKELIDGMLEAVAEKGICVYPRPSGEILPDNKDLPFYEVVLERRKDGAYLVTGNMKHFPNRPFIVTARQMLDILSAGEGNYGGEVR